MSDYITERIYLSGPKNRELRISTVTRRAANIIARTSIRAINSRK